jgi:hypothetical protein
MSRLKKYTVIGTQPIEFQAVINAVSEEQALKKADENYLDYDWKEVNIGDWKYEILEEEDDDIETSRYFYDDDDIRRKNE